jgi:hypothetical protein
VKHAGKRCGKYGKVQAYLSLCTLHFALCQRGNILVSLSEYWRDGKGKTPRLPSTTIPQTESHFFARDEVAVLHPIWLNLLVTTVALLLSSGAFLNLITLTGKVASDNAKMQAIESRGAYLFSSPGDFCRH